MSYEELLKSGLAKVPKKVEKRDRFVMPSALVQGAGARTILTNFYDIAGRLRRDPGHLLKFLLKELATKGEFKDNRLIVLGKFPQELVNRKLEFYVKSYVLCPECGKPDTKIVKRDRYTFLVCEACGASHSLG